MSPASSRRVLLLSSVLPWPWPSGDTAGIFTGTRGFIGGLRPPGGTLLLARCGPEGSRLARAFPPGKKGRGGRAPRALTLLRRGKGARVARAPAEPPAVARRA